MKKAGENAASRKLATAEHLMRVIDTAVEEARFMGFSPFQTYSNPSNQYLLNEGGQPVFRNPHNSDAEALWRIGRDAYRLLEVKSREDFIARFDSFRTSTAQWREFISEMAEDGAFADGDGNTLSARALFIEHRTEAEILALTAQILEQFREKGSVDVVDQTRGDNLLFACLREIDNAITGMSVDGRGSVASVVSAVNALADAQAELNGSPQFQKVRRKMAYEGGIARHQRDPKAAEKRLVFESYREWRANPSLFKSKAAFARAMLEKCQHLESNKKIEDWVRAWDAAAKSGTQPAG